MFDVGISDRNGKECAQNVTITEPGAGGYGGGGYGGGYGGGKGKDKGKGG